MAAATKKANADPCTQVEQAWLDAGRRGDVKTMQGLRKTHPKWLALDRVVASKSSQQRDNDGESFCDWESFHLPTVGASALHAAAWDGNYAVLEFLLKEGQKVDTKGGQGLTVLMATLMRHNVQALRAVFQGSSIVQLNKVVDCRKEDAERLEHTLKVVKLLLQHGADLEARDDSGKTALYLATNDELFEVAKLLVERGARLDARDSSGRSLLLACLQNSPSKSALVANLLISRGAPVDIPDTSGETPMMVAVCRGDIAALQLLMKHPSLADKKKQRSFADAALLKASEFGVVPVARFLLDGGHTSVDVSNAKGETALHLAIMKLHKPLVRVLCGVKSAELLLKARTKEKGESVVHYAARYGSPQELQMVLSISTKGGSPEVNAASSNGLTPLYLATTARTAGSLSDRRAKVAQLEKLGASLFPTGAQLFREVKSSSDTALVASSAAVKRCLAMWVVECGSWPSASSTALYDFCLNWVACVQRPQAPQKLAEAKQKASDVKIPVAAKQVAQTKPKDTKAPVKKGEGVSKSKETKPLTQRPPLSKTLASLVHAGYAVDAFPLLVVLPLKRAEIPRFLGLLTTLSTETKCALLNKLQQELTVAWKRFGDGRAPQQTKAAAKGK